MRLGEGMIPLAIDNPIGQEHDKNGRTLSEMFSKKFGWQVIQGPATQPAPIDAILYSDNVMIGVLESRTRKTHSHEAIQRMGDTYLITDSKLHELMEGGRLFGVPSYLIIQMACGTRWGWVIGNKRGEPNFTWEVRRTQTRATSLSTDQIVRANAYLPMSKGRKW